ncbi:VanW family protein [Flavobacterium gelatinilyticum]|uniref:VanW family protein n=1 Tax=Flavobacterium gelatinilyticum TaxID=3003260 RepID=UPI0024805F84|nr:VanW family protein [Flavobacterium gelatinilyticum]
MIRRWKQFKVSLKLLIRFKTDLLSNALFKFPAKNSSNPVFDYSISLSQEIRKNNGFENKVYNLQLASERINQYVLEPGQIFSFFKIIGNPNSGFRKSRTLVNNTLVEEKGGGICQVSGIIYHISLMAGLEILERHNHSIDIYTDETRFAPLGTDATIVYGYKDLRVRNNFSFPIKFQINVKESSIVVSLLSSELIHKRQLFFESLTDKDSTTVNVLGHDRKLLNQSRYKKLQHSL